MTGALRRLRDRVGRRGASLLFFGLLDLVIGTSLVDPGSRPRNTDPYRALLEVAPYRIWAAVWIIVGLVCFGQAFTRRDTAGFCAAIAVKVVWAAGFFASWILYDAYRAWVAGATWLVFAAFVYLIAGWPEPLRFRAPAPSGPSSSGPEVLR